MCWNRRTGSDACWQLLWSAPFAAHSHMLMFGLLAVVQVLKVWDREVWRMHASNGVRRPRQIRGPKIRAKNTGQRATKGTVLMSQSLSPWCNCRRLGSTLASWRWQDINVGNPLWRWALLSAGTEIRIATWSVQVINTGFSNSAIDRRFSTPVAAAVDGNLSKVVEKKCVGLCCATSCPSPAA